MTRAEILAHMREKGRADALVLRAQAVAGEITDTEIIDREEAVPAYRPGADYTNVNPGAPVAHGGQVYALVIPHNAAHHPDTAPGTVGGQTLWRVKHTTNPAKAKPWVQPDSVNLYMIGECMIWTDGKVKRAKRNTHYSPEEYAPDWEDVEVS